jgi:hypothetical protein
MTAITVATARRKRNINCTTSAKYTTSQAIVEGALVSVSTSSGLALNSADQIGCKFVGIAADSVGSGGVVTVEYGHEELLATTLNLANSGGMACTITDNNTVSTAAGTTNDVLVGEIVEAVSATSAWIAIRKHGAATS